PCPWLSATKQIHSIMSQTGAPHLLRPIDPRLESLAAARGEEVDREIECLILRVAQPLIVSILSRYKGPAAGLSPQDIDDLTSTILLRLVAKLRTLTGEAEPIAEFERYVATLTYNAVNDHLRRVFPARTRLKNRLRYTLLHDRRLERLGGLEEERFRGDGPAGVVLSGDAAKRSDRRRARGDLRRDAIAGDLR